MSTREGCSGAWRQKRIFAGEMFQLLEKKSVFLFSHTVVLKLSGVRGLKDALFEGPFGKGPSDGICGCDEARAARCELPRGPSFDNSLGGTCRGGTLAGSVLAAK